MDKASGQTKLTAVLEAVELVDMHLLTVYPDAYFGIRMIQKALLTAWRAERVHLPPTCFLRRHTD